MKKFLKFLKIGQNTVSKSCHTGVGSAYELQTEKKSIIHLIHLETILENGRKKEL